jgi:hypothetical protein
LRGQKRTQRKSFPLEKSFAMGALEQAENRGVRS